MPGVQIVRSATTEVLGFNSELEKRTDCSDCCADIVSESTSPANGTVYELEGGSVVEVG